MSYKENYALIDWSKPIEIERKPQLPPARSGLPCPMIISDVMDPVEHPCDGQHYSSKSTFRKVTKANGCIEVGNDPARKKPVKRESNDAGIDRAIEKALARAS